MKRADLNKNINKLEAKVNKLKKIKFRYFIHGKYIEGFGPIQMIDDSSTLVRAFKYVKDQLVDSNNELFDELGFDLEDNEKEVKTYLGYDLIEWTEEFKVRAEEINNQLLIDKTYEAIEELSQYLNEDDLFENSVNKFSSLLDDEDEEELSSEPEESED